MISDGVKFCRGDVLCMRQTRIRNTSTVSSSWRKQELNERVNMEYENIHWWCITMFKEGRQTHFSNRYCRRNSYLSEHLSRKIISRHEQSWTRTEERELPSAVRFNKLLIRPCLVFRPEAHLFGVSHTMWDDELHNVTTKQLPDLPISDLWSLIE